jgi:hypothetical protein
MPKQTGEPTDERVGAWARVRPSARQLFPGDQRWRRRRGSGSMVGVLWSLVVQVDVEVRSCKMRWLVM